MESPITIVSGLPRSGTSMMMRVLESAGLPVLTDGVRAADLDNPRGYYELEAVKRADAEGQWLSRAGGRAVKVITYLLPRLPRGPRYRVVFMRRNLDEILRSQQVMLSRRGASPPREPGASPAEGADDAEMRRVLMAHIAETEDWLRGRDDIDVLYISYNRMLIEPRPQLERLTRFLGGDLDVAAMAAVVDPALYRQRPSSGQGGPGGRVAGPSSRADSPPTEERSPGKDSKA